jgi:HEAT repeat protein
VSTLLPVAWIIGPLLMGAPLAAPTDAPQILQEVHDRAEQVRTMNPALAQGLMALQPLPTRARMPRFRSELFLQADAHWVLGERLLNEKDSPEVRAALVHAYASLEGAQANLLLHLAGADRETQVRSAAVTALGRGSTPQGLSAIRLGLKDSSPQVRLVAVSAAGYRADGLEVATMLVSALSDTDASVRAYAARSLGWLECAGAWEPLRPLLQDASGDVRVHALRAMRTVNLADTAALPELDKLVTDPDERVVAVARSL